MWFLPSQINYAHCTRGVISIALSTLRPTQSNPFLKLLHPYAIFNARVALFILHASFFLLLLLIFEIVYTRTAHQWLHRSQTQYYVREWRICVQSYPRRVLASINKRVAGLHYSIFYFIIFYGITVIWHVKDRGGLWRSSTSVKKNGGFTTGHSIFWLEGRLIWGLRAG